MWSALGCNFSHWAVFTFLAFILQTKAPSCPFGGEHLLLKMCPIEALNQFSALKMCETYC